MVYIFRLWHLAPRAWLLGLGSPGARQRRPYPEPSARLGLRLKSHGFSLPGSLCLPIKQLQTAALPANKLGLQVYIPQSTRASAQPPPAPCALRPRQPRSQRAFLCSSGQANETMEEFRLKFVREPKILKGSATHFSRKSLPPALLAVIPALASQ